MIIHLRQEYNQYNFDNETFMAVMRTVLGKNNNKKKYNKKKMIKLINRVNFFFFFIHFFIHFFLLLLCACDVLFYLDRNGDNEVDDSEWTEFVYRFGPLESCYEKAKGVCLP